MEESFSHKKRDLKNIDNVRIGLKQTFGIHTRCLPVFEVDDSSKEATNMLSLLSRGIKTPLIATDE